MPPIQLVDRGLLALLETWKHTKEPLTSYFEGLHQQASMASISRANRTLKSMAYMVDLDVQTINFDTSIWPCLLFPPIMRQRGSQGEREMMHNGDYRCTSVMRSGSDLLYARASVRSVLTVDMSTTLVLSAAT